MELLTYKSVSNTNYFITGSILFLGFAVPTVLFFGPGIILFFLIFGGIPFGTLYLVVKWAKGNKKEKNIGDGEYIFSDTDIRIKTRQKTFSLPYQDIEWVDFKSTKESLLEKFFRRKGPLDSAVGLFFPIHHKLEIKKRDGSYLYIRVPLPQLEKVVGILKEKTN